MDCILPGSSVHGILQARILEWGTISFSRGSFWLRDQTHISCISCIGRKIPYHSAIWEARKKAYTWMNLSTCENMRYTVIFIYIYNIYYIYVWWCYIYMMFYIYIYTYYQCIITMSKQKVERKAQFECKVFYYWVRWQSIVLFKKYDKYIWLCQKNVICINITILSTIEFPE